MIHGLTPALALILCLAAVPAASGERTIARHETYRGPPLCALEHLLRDLERELPRLQRDLHRLEQEIGSRLPELERRIEEMLREFERSLAPPARERRAI